MLGYLNPVPSLPAYIGPYSVGTTEYEIPVSQIPTDSPLASSHPETLKFRLYYPTTTQLSPRLPTYWLPSPQNQWTEAYASFLGASPRLSSFFSRMLALLNYAKIPAASNAPLKETEHGHQFPVVIFSHGLGGNCNTYSSIVGNLASCGMVCAAVEHRDGSAPISFIRSSRKEVLRSIPYQKLSHNPTPDVLDTRNAQLRVRMREMELLYNVLDQLNAGKSFTNHSESKHPSPNLVDALDLTPGRVTWMGHSFGSATVVQFIKSIYYRASLPSLSGSSRKNSPGWEPLYTAKATSQVVQQVTRTSPIVLLDVWTMPLRGESTQWLWERPFPSYDISHGTESESAQPNVLAIMSDEFYKWTDLRNRTRALLSANPVEAIARFDKEKVQIEADAQAQQDLQKSTTSPQNTPLTNTTSTRPSLPSTLPDELINSNHLTTHQFPSPPTPSISPSPSPLPSGTPLQSSSSKTSLSSTTPPPKALLFRVPQSAHLSQSDFGVLFPTITKWLMKSHDPAETIRINVCGALALIRGCGVKVDVTGIEELDDVREGSEGEGVVDWMKDRKRWMRIGLD